MRISKCEMRTLMFEECELRIEDNFAFRISKFAFLIAC